MTHKRHHPQVIITAQDLTRPVYLIQTTDFSKLTHTEAVKTLSEIMPFLDEHGIERLAAKFISSPDDS